jgi:hypothetical protein
VRATYTLARYHFVSHDVRMPMCLSKSHDDGTQMCLSKSQDDDDGTPM